MAETRFPGSGWRPLTWSRQLPVIPLPTGPAPSKIHALLGLWPEDCAPQSTEFPTLGEPLRSGSGATPPGFSPIGLEDCRFVGVVCQRPPVLFEVSLQVVHVLHRGVTAHKTCEPPAGRIVDHVDQQHLFPATFQPVVTARVQLHQLSEATAALAIHAPSRSAASAAATTWLRSSTSAPSPGSHRSCASSPGTPRPT